MKKMICCILVFVLVIAVFSGCKPNDVPQINTTEDTGSSNTLDANISENIDAEQKKPDTTVPEHLSKPYVLVDEQHPSIIEDTLKNLDWNTLLKKIPATHYEEYPELADAPITATIHKGGQVTQLDINDPRLVRLLNFYNNAMHHNMCAITQGSFTPTDLERIENESYRLVLTYTGDGSFETSFDTVIVCSEGFVGIRHNVPYGNYPSSAFGRYPLYAKYNWLDLFGF